MKIDPLQDGISSIEYVDHMGSDLSVVNAARVSFDKQSKWDGNSEASESELIFKVLKDGDKRLIHYLAEHNHWTPFGHASLSIRVKAPIFVARQLVKHQVGLVWNEVSRRYVSDNVQIYTPTTVHLAPEGSIKQGSSDQTTSEWESSMKTNAMAAVTLYNEMIANGVAPEDARMVLPLSMYTEWVWSGTLAAWARVCKLRCDPHTQSHTRTYGEGIARIARDTFPAAFAALMKD